MIEDSLKKANATFVHDMDGGMDAYIGSSAVLNLSGGQKQRIAIARALVKNPKLMILDEATSALDPRSEKEVQGAIDKIAHESSSNGGKLTIIMIAHRLQTIMSAQNLLYLESKNTMLSAAKGTPEYDEIIKRLQEQNYAHQQDDEKDAKKKELRDKVGGKDENDLDDKEQLQLQKQLAIEKESSAHKVEKKLEGVSFARIMSYYHPKWMGYSAFLIAAINAFAFPLFGFIFSKLMFILMSVGHTKTFGKDRDFWCGMFLLECAIIGIVSFFQKYVFSYVGENLTFDVRFDLFKGIIYKHLQWFDDKRRAPGILSNVLSEDIGALNGLTTENFAIVTEAFLGLVIGVIFALVYNWKMGLVSLAFVPFVILGSILTSQLQWKQKGRSKASEENKEVDFYQASNALLSDILMNYRTVIGFGDKNVAYLLEKFDELLREPNMLGIKNAHVSGFYFGYG